MAQVNDTRDFWRLPRTSRRVPTAALLGTQPRETVRRAHEGRESWGVRATSGWALRAVQQAHGVQSQHQETTAVGSTGNNLSAPKTTTVNLRPHWESVPVKRI